MYNHVLVALELVGPEDYLIEAALKLSSNSSGIRFIHVFEAPIYPADSYSGDIQLKVREKEVANVRSQFADLAERYSLTVDHHDIAVGRPASEIHRTANEVHTDLIVVGSHGRHGLSRLLGSTANAVLHGASCDVLAVRFAS